MRKPVIYDTGKHRPLDTGEQISGNDVHVSSDADNIIRVSSGDGGLYAKPKVAASTTVRLSGAGSEATPLSAEVICAPNTTYEANALTVTDVGLMVGRNAVRDFDVRTSRTATRGEEITVVPGMASDVRIWNELLVLSGNPGSTFIVDLRGIGHDQSQAKRLRITWETGGTVHNTDPIRLRFKTPTGRLITPAGVEVDSEWFMLQEVRGLVIVYDLYLFHSGAHPLLLNMTQQPADTYTFEHTLTASYDDVSAPGRMTVSLQSLPCDYAGFPYMIDMYLQARLMSQTGTVRILNVSSDLAGFSQEDMRDIGLSPENRTWTWRRRIEGVLSPGSANRSSMNYANVNVDIPDTLQFSDVSGSVEFRLFVTLTRLTHVKYT